MVDDDDSSDAEGHRQRPLSSHRRFTRRLQHCKSRSLSPRIKSRNEVEPILMRPVSADDSPRKLQYKLHSASKFDVPEIPTRSKVTKMKSMTSLNLNLTEDDESSYGDDHDHDDENYDNVSDSDSDCSNSHYERTTNLCATVWKRKSGISGKFKSTYAIASEKVHEKATTFKSTFKPKAAKFSNLSWIRRKIVLDGRMLMYYHKDAEVDGYPNTTQSARPSKPYISLNTSTNTPRGVIDIAKRNVIVSVSHTKHAPTPYSLTVAMKTDTNWTICFDNEKDLTKWMYALMDIHVRRSVLSNRRLNQKGEGYHHVSPCFDQDQWIPSPKRFSRDLESTSGSDIAKEIHDTDYDPEATTVCEQMPLLNGVTHNYSSVNQHQSSLVGTLPLVESHKYLPASSSMTITRNDFIILMAILNISFGYICYLAINKNIIVSFLYITFIINICSVILFKRNENHAPKYMANSFGYSTSPRDRLSIRSSKEYMTNMNLGSELKWTLGTKNDVVQHDSIVDRTSVKKLSDNSTPKIRQRVQTISNTSKIHSNLNGSKPRAGASLIRLKEPNGSRLNKDDVPMNGWFQAPVAATQTRSATYLSSKKKNCCPASLYELVEADCFASDHQMFEMGQQFDLSGIKLNQDTDGITIKTWNAPDIFVISLTLPSTAPKLGFSSNDKNGYILVGYYRMRKETRAILHELTRPDYDGNDKGLAAGLLDENQKSMVKGVKLWEEWCKNAPTDPEMQKRFKFIAKGDNLREVGCPRWICNYNGKPILIKRPGVTGFLFSYDNMMEFDLSLLPFPYLFKSAMTYLQESLFAKMLMTFSFVIEGRTEDELPELLIGNGLQICYLQTEIIPSTKDIFK